MYVSTKETRLLGILNRWWNMFQYNIVSIEIFIWYYVKIGKRERKNQAHILRERKNLKNYALSNVNNRICLQVDDWYSYGNQIGTVTYRWINYNLIGSHKNITFCGFWWRLKKKHWLFIGKQINYFSQCVSS